MKRSKFTREQVGFILRQREEGTAVDEICRKAGISEAQEIRWPDAIQRLKRLRVRRQSWSIRAPSSFRAERLNAHWF